MLNNEVFFWNCFRLPTPYSKTLQSTTFETSLHLSLEDFAQTLDLVLFAAISLNISEVWTDQLVGHLNLWT
jgi:hypothetical protein